MKKKVNCDGYYQQVHKKCGGEIVLIANKIKLKCICKKCMTIWNMQLPLYGIEVNIQAPKEFKNYNPKVK